MNLTSFSFIIFCILTFTLYFSFPKKYKWIVLSVSSLFFLFYKNVTLSTLLQALIILFVSYFIGLKLEKNKNTKTGKKYLTFGILIILGVLIYLKYTNLFLTTFNHLFNLFNINFQFELVHHNSLIGLSYFSLIMIGYLTDIYRGVTNAEKNIFKCALFMSYFPILNSGPFVKYDQMKESLYKDHKFDFDRLKRGAIRVLWGIFKILVISQRLGIFVDKVYGDLTKFKGVYVVIACLFFTLQLYTNFSGSIDMIMGISEIFDIKLPENFDAPFFSKTITELWRRWHITLGAWLKDYIFYPLLKSDFMQKIGKFCKEKFGKKAYKKVPLYLSMFVMWILIGAWHGGAYTFIIGSGLLQFIYMFLEDNLTPISDKINNKLGINKETFIYRLYQRIRTFLLFSFSMIFFRVSKAIKIIKAMFVRNYHVLIGKSLFKAGLNISNFAVLIIALVILFIVELFKNRGKDVRDILDKQNIVFRWIIYFALIFGIIIFGCYGVGYNPADFIYREF